MAGDIDLSKPSGGQNCVLRTREFTEDYFESDASLSYLGPDFTITVGVSNVFDAAPEQVHDGVANRNNVVTSMGHDMFGRSWFVSLSKSF